MSVRLFAVLCALGLVHAVVFAQPKESPPADKEDAGHVLGSAEILEYRGSLSGYRSAEYMGKSFDFKITAPTAADPNGSIDFGSVWGTEVYTDDSDLTAAAVHAGVLKPGETAVVPVTILPGRSGYRGTVQNGVTSTDYAAWTGTYMVEAANRKEDVKPVVVDTVKDAPESMADVDADSGETFKYRVTGSTKGKVYGADIYSADSSLAAAAVHAGVLADGESGIIKVMVLPGRSRYAALERAGVKSLAKDKSPRSYILDLAE